MICRNDLLNSIKYAHMAITAYAVCICDEATPEERAMFEEFGTVLSEQLKVLREHAQKKYGYGEIHRSC